LSPEQTDEQDASTVDCEQRTDRVELSGEDLEYDERKRKLADCCTDVCALKRSLCCADFDQLCARQDD
jgi:hypothetical protein